VRGIHCSKEVHDIVFPWDIDVRKQTTKETHRCIVIISAKWFNQQLHRILH
jgi:hypothetical protein